MNILHTVEFYYPSTGGSQEVVRQISEKLAGRGHQITVATTKLEGRSFSEFNGVSIKEFELSGNLARGIRGDKGAYLSYLTNSKFDLVMNYAAQSWPSDLAFTVLNKLSSKKVLVPCGFSGLNLPEYAEYYQSMAAWLKMYDACVFLSERYQDIDYAMRVGADRNVLIPNGAGEDEFGGEGRDIRQSLGIPDGHLLILLVGSHTGMKGHKEAMAIFKKAHIGPATLLIVANDFGRGCGKRCALSERLLNSGIYSNMRGKQVIVTSLNREDTVSAYKSADLFLFPSNIECSPIVLFEAMASGTPFLTTDVGNALEIIEWSGGGVSLPTIRTQGGYRTAELGGSVKVLEELADDKDRREDLGRKGWEAWHERFTWEKIAQQYEDLYISLVENKPIERIGFSK